MITPRNIDTETEEEFGQRYDAYIISIRQELKERFANQPRPVVMRQLEEQPEYLEQWAELEIPNMVEPTRYTDPYIDHIHEELTALIPQLNHYHNDPTTISDMSTQDGAIWDRLQEIILTAKAMQIAVVG